MFCGTTERRYLSSDFFQQEIRGAAAFGGERGPSEGNKSTNERTKRIVEGEWRSQKRELKLRLEKGRIDRRTEEEARSQQRWRGAQI
jgi:hypothetical protein